ncbi:hypothetical protein [Nonomuraea dietziae]|uniref:hypothetical protein n=1 Tax=Nonomuraea dietziae TaxID=65515 RepID=UPI0031CDC176
MPRRIASATRRDRSSRRVQVALDPAERGGGVVHRQRPRVCSSVRIRAAPGAGPSRVLRATAPGTSARRNCPSQ